MLFEIVLTFEGVKSKETNPAAEQAKPPPATTFEKNRMFHLQSQWRFLPLVTDLHFQDLAIVGVFGIIGVACKYLISLFASVCLRSTFGIYIYTHLQLWLRLCAHTAVGERGKSHISHTRKLKI